MVWSGTVSGVDERGGAGIAPEAAGGGVGAAPEPKLLHGSARALEHVQDALSIVVGALLVVLAAVVLVAGVADFVRSVGHEPVVTAGTRVLDDLLLVLILVEIVHTVVLSVRAHTLVPEPFLVVGLVAVVRKVLLLMGQQQPAGTTQLALLIGMVAVFVASLLLIHRLGPESRKGS